MRTALQGAFFAAAGVDPDVARAALEVFACLTLPQDVMQRLGFAQRITAFTGKAPSAPAGPSRSELLALVNA
jgi:hypothetical protein